MNTSQKIPANNNKLTVRQKQNGESINIFQAMAENVDTAIIISDLASKIIYSNRVAYDLLSYDYEKRELDGALVDIFAPEQRAPQAEVIAQVIATDNRSTVETIAIRKDGSTVNVAVTRFPLFDEQNRLTNIGTILRDITERKQAEEKIRESETRFRWFTEATVEGLVFHERGTIIDANPAILAMLGFSDKSEFIGRNLLEFVAPEFHEAVLHNMQLDATHSHEIECIRKDGTIFPVENITRTYKEDGRVIRASSIRDITERKAAVRAIQENEQRLRALFESANDAIFTLREDKVIDANSKTLEIFKLESKDQIIGHSVGEFSPELQPDGVPSAQRVGEKVIRALRDEKQFFEWRHLHGDGTPFDAEISLNSVKVGGEMLLQAVIRDITERKEATRAIQENEQRFRALFENASDAIFTLREDKVIDVNSKTLEIFKWESRDQVIGHSVGDFSPEFQPDGIRSAQKAGEKINLAFHGEPQFFEFRHLQADGTPFDAEVSLNRLKIGGEILVQAILRDITERKQLETQVQEALEKRGYQVQVSTDISQEVAAATELNDLFDRVVTLTRERLGYYHTQLLRYDTLRDAVVLVNGYGEIGQKMLASGHQMRMGEGLIGTAAATGETVMRSTLADDPDWQLNPLLPETKGEIAVPIKWQDKVLGVLDVQSNQAGALAEDDRLLLEGLCGQIAIAMHSAELMEVVRQNEARLAEALKIARLGNWEYDFENDLFEFSDAFYDIFRTSAEKVGGYKISSADYARHFVHPDDAPLVGTEIQKILDGKDRFSTIHLEHRIIFSDGETGYIAANINVERDENGKITRWYGANQDITERKRAEEALHHSQQEMAERLEELNYLYRNMSHEGWKAYRETGEFPTGFMFDQISTKPVEEVPLTDENLASVPMKVLGGEVVGTLAVASDPHNPISTEDIAFLQKVSDQIALALESARLTAQTQSALAQSERLFAASSQLTQIADLQQLVKVVAETMNIPQMNRALLATFGYDAEGNITSMTVDANWWNGSGHAPTPVGTAYEREALKNMQGYLGSAILFSQDAMNDERIDPVTRERANAQNIRAMAFLPLQVGGREIGILILEAEEVYNFTAEETRLFGSLAPQIATVLENRRQFEQAQRQAEREAMLNTINQKIQSATSVEAVLQIAARELGRALDASKAVAQLSVVKKNGNGANGKDHQ